MWVQDGVTVCFGHGRERRRNICIQFANMFLNWHINKLLKVMGEVSILSCSSARSWEPGKGNYFWSSAVIHSQITVWGDLGHCCSCLFPWLTLEVAAPETVLQQWLGARDFWLIGEWTCTRQRTSDLWAALSLPKYHPAWQLLLPDSCHRHNELLHLCWQLALGCSCSGMRFDQKILLLIFQPNMEECLACWLSWKGGWLKGTSWRYRTCIKFLLFCSNVSAWILWSQWGCLKIRICPKLQHLWLKDMKSLLKPCWSEGTHGLLCCPLWIRHCNRPPAELKLLAFHQF